MTLCSARSLSLALIASLLPLSAPTVLADISAGPTPGQKLMQEQLVKRRARIRERRDFAIPRLRQLVKKYGLKTGADGSADDQVLEEMAKDKVTSDQLNTYYWKIYSSLGTSPGSAARKEAAKLLGAELEAAYKKLPKLTSAEAIADQAMTRKVFDMSLAYLAGNSCKPEERIRVYRGVGTQPVIRKKGDSSGWQVPNDLMNSIFFGLIVKGVADQSMQPVVNATKSNVGLDIGEMAYPLFKNIAEQFMMPLDWPKLMGVGRSVGYATGAEMINGRFSYIAAAHTGSSNSSPLISVSIDPNQMAGYGPATLVLDVCPERLMPSRQDIGSRFMNEAEFYLPLFIAKEEVKAIRGAECVKAGRDPLNPPKGCGQNGYSKYEGEGEDDSEANIYTFVDQDAPQANTRRYRRMFFNSGHDFERGFEMRISSYLSSTVDNSSIGLATTERYDRLARDFYARLGKVEGTGAALTQKFRTEVVPKLPLTVDCGLVQKYIDKTREVVMAIRASLKSKKRKNWDEKLVKMTSAEIKTYTQDANSLTAGVKQYKADQAKTCPNLKFGAGW